MTYLTKLMTIMATSVFAVIATCASAATFNIKDFGAKGNGKTVNTQAINDAIVACEQAGGGKVIVPKGIYLSGTIIMKSNVNLVLEENAVIKGVNDLTAYRAYQPVGDLSRYGIMNGNYKEENRWTRALILGMGIHNSSITGDGTIDGSHVEDPQGEEKMRGPHTILFGESKNLEISGITINNASNYAFMSYEIENATFHNISIHQGWDGIHIRGGKNILIRNCNFQTGDDAIAGGYWNNMVITDCNINSSCNGIRIIMPVNGMSISNCIFQGPGVYPHRTSKELKRNNSLSGIILQPGGWGKAPGMVENVHIHNLQIDNFATPVTMILNEGNNANGIIVEKIKATNIYLSGYSVESWKGGKYDNIIFRDIYTEFKGSDDPEVLDIEMKQPHTDSRQMPYWAFYANNTGKITLENIEFKYTGKEIRPAMCFDNVNTVVLKNVECQDVPNVETTVFKRVTVVDRK